MSAVMTIDSLSSWSSVPVCSSGAAAGLVPDGLVEELLERVRSEGVELIGEGGLLAELTKRLLERGLDEELSAHLGYQRGDPGGRGSGNSRNGPRNVC